MRKNSLSQPSVSRRAVAEKIREDARRFVDSLAERLNELERMAAKARGYDRFVPSRYAEFKALFQEFTQLCEEFQLLSYLTEECLARFERTDKEHWSEHSQLENYYRCLQVPMLRQVITTFLSLLKVWTDRLENGDGLPLGATEIFLETVRVIHHAKVELLRPRYLAYIDDAALRDAEQAERLLRALMGKAPQLIDLATGKALAAPPEPPRPEAETDERASEWPTGGSTDSWMSW